MFPKMRKVAVPLPKHSAIFGHFASSQIVWRCEERNLFFSETAEAPPDNGTFNQSG